MILLTTLNKKKTIRFIGNQLTEMTDCIHSTNVNELLRWKSATLIDINEQNSLWEMSHLSIVNGSDKLLSLNKTIQMEDYCVCVFVQRLGMLLIKSTHNYISKENNVLGNHICRNLLKTECSTLRDC